MNLTTAWRTKLYEAICHENWMHAEAIFLRLFSADPGLDPPVFDDEATGGSYAGQPLVMAAGVDGAGTNTDPVTFANMPAGTWTHFAIADRAGGTDPNHVILVGALTSARTTAAGSSLTLAPGDLELTIA